MLAKLNSLKSEDDEHKNQDGKSRFTNRLQKDIMNRVIFVRAFAKKNSEKTIPKLPVTKSEKMEEMADKLFPSNPNTPPVPIVTPKFSVSRTVKVNPHEARREKAKLTGKLSTNHRRECVFVPSDEN